MYTKDKEGPLHKSIRIWRNKYWSAVALCCVLLVVTVATAITATTQTKSVNTVQQDENLIFSPLAFAPSSVAGMFKLLDDYSHTYIQEAQTTKKAKLLTFDEDSNWAQESFAEFVDGFENWCYDTTQLTIDLEHHYTVNDVPAYLAKITNVINIEKCTGTLEVLKPTYSQRMYYNYKDVDYYLAMTGDATSSSSPWIHVSRDSDRDVLQFCQDSVITTTSVATVNKILKAVAQSGAYNTMDGVLDTFYVSWKGDIDDRLLTPTFAYSSTEYVTRVDVQCCGDLVYCIITYNYDNSKIGVTDETFKYTFLVTDQVIGHDFPSYVKKHAKDNTDVITRILEEV